MKNRFIRIILSSLLLSGTVLAEHQGKLLKINGHKLMVSEWSTPSDSNHSVLLLSGPTDNWNSDSAWFARLAPKLARNYRVLSIDRAGQQTDNPDAPVGYKQFGKDLAALIPRLDLDNLHIIAFASANLALHKYFAEATPGQIKSITLIDPDVLLPYSMSRYRSDAKPFKDNLQKYLEYIAAGKYNQRAIQKNDIELKHLKVLAGDDPDTDWDYLNKTFQSRLSISNLQNLFKEIARYDEDLDAASKTQLPRNIPLIILDTDFEDAYIAKTEKDEDKAGLIQWKTEAASYYQQLAADSVKGQYIHLKTQEHLIPFSDPEQLLKIIQQQARNN